MSDYDIATLEINYLYILYGPSFYTITKVWYELITEIVLLVLGNKTTKLTNSR